LQLASGISDSINFENLLWRNQLNGWLLDAAVFMILDFVLYTVFSWAFYGQKVEKSFAAFKKNLVFGVLLTLAHSFFSLEGYSVLIMLRRKIPFYSSNVLTFAVGMRILNCLSSVLFILYNTISEASKNKDTAVLKEIKKDIAVLKEAHQDTTVLKEAKILDKKEVLTIEKLLSESLSSDVDFIKDLSPSLRRRMQ
jgi:hypothetical protein